MNNPNGSDPNTPPMAPPPMNFNPAPGAVPPPMTANPGGMPPMEIPSAQPAQMVQVGQGPKPLDDVHLDELLHIMVDRKASDLHLCADSEPVLREDGALQRLTQYQKFSPTVLQRMLYEIISDENVHKFETTLELDFSYSLPVPMSMRTPGGPTVRSRFRVNFYRERGSIAAAFRLISSSIPTCRDLNLPPLLETLTERPRGLILVTGPTGSGKSTSLAAMINFINMTRACHLITIEDPIEYLHQHKLSLINQRELGGDTRSFNNALRASLREDPDVLLVGEMRDTETIALAITAAETGHLVFATLHTNSAPESIDRMIDVFPPGQQEQIRIQLANNVVAIISQQLLPRAGAPGRVPANEIMIATPAIRNLIRENKTHQIPSMIQTSGGLGMTTMDQCLRDLYQKGVVTLDEVMSRANNVEELKKMINVMPPGGSGPANERRR